MKLVTVFPGDVFHQDQFLIGIYNRLAANPPAGFSVLQHTCIEDLCDQVSDNNEQLELLEIVAHGNPGCLGVLDADTTATLGNYLKVVKPTCQVYLSGCNTGTTGFDPNSDVPEHFDIATNLSSLVPCQVFGSMGYLNEYTVAEGTVACSTDDWEEEIGWVYAGAKDDYGTNAFALKSKPEYVKHATPFPRAMPMLVRHGPMNPQQEAALDAVLEPLVNTPSQNIKLNPRVAPDLTVTYYGRIFDLLYNGRAVREKLTGNTWRINMSQATLALLHPLWTPAPVKQ
jgi:hypothetical protein